jgi:catechol 2,3-dioxygenase-like lactoylglutathione lyase family enzyme
MKRSSSARSSRKTSPSPALTIVTLGVSDVAASRAFYEKGLGFHVSKSSQGDIVFMQAGGVVLALYPHDELAKDARAASTKGKSKKGDAFRGVTLAWNVGGEKEVDAALARAKKAGATIAKPAEKAFWGGYSGYFTDPDGHAWEVAHNPFWKLAADGRLVLPA